MAKFRTKIMILICILFFIKISLQNRFLDDKILKTNLKLCTDGAKLDFVSIEDDVFFAMVANGFTLEDRAQQPG